MFSVVIIFGKWILFPFLHFSFLSYFQYFMIYEILSYFEESRKILKPQPEHNIKNGLKLKYVQTMKNQNCNNGIIGTTGRKLWKINMNVTQWNMMTNYLEFEL